MNHVLLLLVLGFSIHLPASTNQLQDGPILIATPYPFNASKSTRLECFSNEQGPIFSLMIVADMTDDYPDLLPLKSVRTNVTNNGSVVLNISAPFNYSQLEANIQCRARYPYGVEKISELAVLSVVEIVEKQFLSIKTSAQDNATIHCRTYGTDVSIGWNFTSDLSEKLFEPLPIGVRISDGYISNDTLIIDYVSYASHHGYYRCQAKNELLNQTYEDQSIFHLQVQKTKTWIPILIACIIIALVIVALIICSKYCQRTGKNNSNSTENPPARRIFDPVGLSSGVETAASMSLHNERRETKIEQHLELK